MKPRLQSHGVKAFAASCVRGPTLFRDQAACQDQVCEPKWRIAWVLDTPFIMRFQAIAMRQAFTYGNIVRNCIEICQDPLGTRALKRVLQGKRGSTGWFKFKKASTLWCRGELKKQDPNTIYSFPSTSLSKLFHSFACVHAGQVPEQGSLLPRLIQEVLGHQVLVALDHLRGSAATALKAALHAGRQVLHGRQQVQCTLLS